MLEAWKTEVIHLEESSGEGFGGGERSHLDEIAKALQRGRKCCHLGPPLVRAKGFAITTLRFRRT